MAKCYHPERKGLLCHPDHCARGLYREDWRDIVDTCSYRRGKLSEEEKEALLNDG